MFARSALVSQAENTTSCSGTWLSEGHWRYFHPWRRELMWINGTFGEFSRWVSQARTENCSFQWAWEFLAPAPLSATPLTPTQMGLNFLICKDRDWARYLRRALLEDSSRIPSTIRVLESLQPPHSWPFWLGLFNVTSRLEGSMLVPAVLKPSFSPWGNRRTLQVPWNNLVPYICAEN